jgi:hypothetical protein
MQLPPAVKRLALSFAVGVALPLSAGAQGSLIEGLVKNATDINVFGLITGTPGGPVTSRAPHGARGMGFELSYDLSDPGASAGAAPTGAKQSDTTAAKKPPGADTSKGKPETDKAQPFFPVLWNDTIRIELAVGYAQSGGYKSRVARNDFYMSLRDLPALTVYASPISAPKGALRYLFLGAVPFVGVRTGLVSIQSGHAYSDTATYGVGGQTFQLGGAVGLSWDVGNFSLFSEGSYVRRQFPSVDWSVSGRGVVPAAFPKSINFSGFTLSTGLTIELKKHIGR